MLNSLNEQADEINKLFKEETSTGVENVENIKTNENLQQLGEKEETVNNNVGHFDKQAMTPTRFLLKTVDDITESNLNVTQLINEKKQQEQKRIELENKLEEIGNENQKVVHMFKAGNTEVFLPIDKQTN